MSSSTKPKIPKYKGQLDHSKLTTLLDPPDDLTHSIPSVSKLLNRRKIMKSLQEDKTKSDMRQPVPAPTVASKPLSIQKTQLKSTKRSLSNWSPDQLKMASDPMGKALFHLFQSATVQAALFMAIQHTAAGKIFGASAGVQIENGSPFWGGLKWQPQQFADVWKTLTEEGFAEFHPEAQNITRTAFDVDPGHWLTLIRVGSPERCRGIVAIVSSQSIESRLFNELELFGADPAPVRKAA
jgi:hypothetical protein